MPDRGSRTDFLIITGLSLSLFLYFMVTAAASGYGFFIDELYYIACAKRLAFGYIDHPPLSVALLALNRWFLGDSITAIRILPALAASANVFMAGMVARRLGGSRAAMILTALAVIAMPVFLLMSSFYSMNAFEPLVWTVIIYYVIRLVQDENPRLWLIVGVLMGLGLEMKHTMALYGIALILGMAITDARRHLWNKWFLWGMLGCFLLLVPNIIWQYVHGFPSLEFYRNAMVNKNVPKAPLNVVLEQILFANPFAFPLWIAGLGYLFFSADAKRLRLLAWAYFLLLVVMVVGASSRPDRIGAMYTVLFAAGAVAIDKIRLPGARRSVVLTQGVLLVAGALAVLPVFTPLFSPALTREYLSAIGVSFDLESGKRNEPLPQWLADRLGWEELAADVGRVYHALTPDEQRHAVIVSTNYGEAGALELYGPAYGLPAVYATHNSYHLWGPPSDTMTTYLGVFVERRDLEGRFENVVEAGIHTCEDCTRQQRRIPIYVARGPRFSITAEWPKFKIYD